MIYRRKNDTQQVVLYNEDEKRIIVQGDAQLSEKIITKTKISVCSLCKRPFDTSSPSVFMDRDYFRHLEAIVRRERQGTRPAILPANTSHIPSSAFNQGYYKRFFREGRRLGRGARGQVYLVQHILENELLGEYAIKKVPVGDNVEWLQRMLKEVHIMETLRHPNVISYKHSWLEIGKSSMFAPAVPCLFILMEYANGGNLENLVYSETIEFRQSGGELKELEEIAYVPLRIAMEVFFGICRGLEHLHRLGIIHRDLKPQNILLNYPRGNATSLQVMISDFGECNAIDESMREDTARTGATGTIEFCAPELFKTDELGYFTERHSILTDIWSLGIILYYLLFGGQLPYRNIDDVDTLKKDMIAMKSIHIPKTRKDIPIELSNLLQTLLEIEPSKRITISEVTTKVEFLLNAIKEEANLKLRLPPQLPSAQILVASSIIELSARFLNWWVVSILTFIIGTLFCYPQSLNWTCFLFSVTVYFIRKRISSITIAGLLIFWFIWILIANKTICAC